MCVQNEHAFIRYAFTSSLILLKTFWAFFLEGLVIVCLPSPSPYSCLLSGLTVGGLVMTL